MSASPLMGAGFERARSAIAKELHAALGRRMAESGLDASQAFASGFEALFETVAARVDAQLGTQFARMPPIQRQAVRLFLQSRLAGLKSLPGLADFTRLFG